MQVTRASPDGALGQKHVHQIHTSTKKTKKMMIVQKNRKASTIQGTQEIIIDPPFDTHV